MIRRNSHFFMPLSKINFMPHCFLSQLKAALNEAQKNASLLAEYHELYELQRRRLESQVFMLTEERELWSTAAYSLAMKVRVTTLSVCWQSTTSCMSYRDSLIFVPWLNSSNFLYKYATFNSQSMWKGYSKQQEFRQVCPSAQTHQVFTVHLHNIWN